MHYVVSNRINAFFFDKTRYLNIPYFANNYIIKIIFDKINYVFENWKFNELENIS